MEIIRHEISLLHAKLNMAPAVAIIGPRQVGKTTFAIQAAKSLDVGYIYLDMESGQDVAKLGDDPESFFAFYKDKLVIIDEIQAYPILFSRLRSIVDRDRRNGRFLLLGSASPNLVHGVSESLAGRISYLDLHPLKLSEITPNYSMQFHWFRGGFPRAFLAETDAVYADWMQSYIRTYIQTDLNTLFGYNLNPIITTKLWNMLAHLHGAMANMQDLSRSVGVTGPVVNRYIDFLEGAFLVYKLQPWFTNAGKRLVKAPKIYIKDTGILHALLSISSLENLNVHPIVGASWEGYVIEQIMYHIGPDFQFYFYRTHTGTEIDLVIVKGAKPIAAIEIKYSNIPTPTKGFFIGIEDLQTKQNFIITPASDTYPHKNALVCNLSTFVKDYLPNLNGGL
jgi:predicted AAA+ superfamily ATPase